MVGELHRYDVQISDDTGMEPLLDTEIQSTSVGDAARQAILNADLTSIDEGRWRIEISLADDLDEE